MEILAGVAVIWGLIISIFWMLVGWRAMRAHEDLSDDLGLIAAGLNEIKELVEKLVSK